jgi:hypothetical protein
LLSATFSNVVMPFSELSFMRSPRPAPFCPSELRHGGHTVRFEVPNRVGHLQKKRAFARGAFISIL